MEANQFVTWSIYVTLSRGATRPKDFGKDKTNNSGRKEYHSCIASK